MARFIIDSKVYDTEKMEFVAKVKKMYPLNSFFLEKLYGKDAGMWHDCGLYKSAKGRFLLMRRETYNQACGEAITEAEAKALLMQYDYETYRRLYGELEEA